MCLRVIVGRVRKQRVICPIYPLVRTGGQAGPGLLYNTEKDLEDKDDSRRTVQEGKTTQEIKIRGKTTQEVKIRGKTTQPALLICQVKTY